MYVSVVLIVSRRSYAPDIFRMRKHLPHVMFKWLCSSGHIHLVKFNWLCSSGHIHLTAEVSGPGELSPDHDEQIMHTAWEDIPSCLPSNPSFSVVVALTFT